MSGMLRSAFIVSLLSLATGLISFVNQVVLAQSLGASAAMEAYVLGISLPLTVMGLLTGMLGYVVVPALQKAEAEAGTSEGLLRALVTGLSCGTALVGVVGFLVTNPLFTVIAPRSSAALTAGATTVARIAWLWLPLAVTGAVYTAGLHVRQRFLAATLSQSLPIVGTMLGCILLFPRFGVIGLIVGQLAGYASLWLVVRIAIGPLTRAYDWEGFNRIWPRLPAALTALLVFVFAPFSDSFWGSRLGPSSVSYLGYGQRFTIGIASLAVIGATTVLFPRFARQAAEGASADLRKGVAKTVRMMLLVTVPLAISLGEMALPLTQLMFQRGAFTLADSQAVAGLLKPMLVALVAVCSAGLLFKALFANDDVRGAAVLSAICASIYFALSGALSRSFGVAGIGTAYAISFWLLVALSLRRIFRADSWRDVWCANRRFILMLFLNSAVVAAVVWIANMFLRDLMVHEPWHRAVCMAVTGVTGALIYLITASHLFIIPEMLELATGIKRLRKANVP